MLCACLFVDMRLHVFYMHSDSFDMHKEIVLSFKLKKKDDYFESLYNKNKKQPQT